MIRWIATRRLRDGKKTATVAIGSPERVKSDQWRCPCRITIGRRGRVTWVYGLDALQALQIALEFIRSELEGKKLTWEGGESGDAGVYRVVTTALNLSMKTHLNAVIDRELAKINEMLRTPAGRVRFRRKFPEELDRL
jgi:hypothetical protein